MALIDEINEHMRREFVRYALKRLAEPSLGEVLNHPEKWRIVRVTSSGFDVVPVEPQQSPTEQENRPGENRMR